MAVQTKSTSTSQKSTKRRKRSAAKSTGTRTAGASGATQPHVANLYDFTTSFFTLMGGIVKRVDRRKHGPLLVTLSAELAEYFGVESLHLAFHQAEPVQGQALVAHGSPIFDKMITYLERKSAVALQQLPTRHGAGEELLQAVRPTNAGIVNLRTQQETHDLYAFHWRITYRADDKREELYTVLLDQEGQRLSLLDEAAEPAGNAAAPFALDTLLADAEPPPSETNDDGQPIPPRLPPMTHLVRLAEMARKYAVYHADVRCVSHEAEILPRLYKTLNRLSTYYQQQIEEVYEAHDPTGEKRQALEVDLERKLAEEVENHRLRVQLQLVSYVVLRMPVTTVHMTLSDGKQEVAVAVDRNRYTGLLRRPLCHACGRELSTVALDRNGHLTCDECIEQCDSCQDLLCAACGVAPCPACGKANCDTCGQLCWACGERACADHISSCPVCGDAVCHACQTECAVCGVRQCRSHLRLDHVRSVRGETVLVCSECAIRCPGCDQFSAETGLCANSGQRFCQDCLVTCTTCGKQVGPGFYARFDDNPYCFSCLEECPSCHNRALAVTSCPTCCTGFCAACGQVCAVCGETHCPDHSHYFGACGHAICSVHVAHCTKCAAELCPQCSPSCAICGGYHCVDHVANCARCGQEYCAACVTRDGLCTTCAAIDPERDAVDLNLEPCATDPRIKALAEHYSWSYGENLRYKIYLGQNSLGRHASIVLTRGETGDTVLAVRGKGAAVAKAQATPKPPVPTEEKETSEWINEFQDWLRRMRRRRGR
jgi:hypothetical protein